MSHDENLRQSQDMEMYNGIAHDVNNLLTAIIGFCYLLKKQTLQNAAAQDTIEDLLKAAKRAVEVAQGCVAICTGQESNIYPATSGTKTFSKNNSETILFAEDDGDVRRILKSILEDNGYKVIEAVNGEEAVRLFREHEDEIRMILLDIIMPEKGGWEVYEEIKKTSPMAKILFLSGYTGDSIIKNKITEEGLNYIPKPVEPDELLIRIRDLLDN